MAINAIGDEAAALLSEPEAGDGAGGSTCAIAQFPLIAMTATTRRRAIKLAMAILPFT